MLWQRVLRRSKFTLPDLPYDYNALEPTISVEIMQLHHQKHHNAYVTNLNIAMDKINHSSHDNAAALGDISGALAQSIRFNGGGHRNHSIFWQNLRPPRDGNTPAHTHLNEAIKSSFGSLDALKKTMSTAAVGIQGSGWAWLGIDLTTKQLRVVTTANQDVAETAGVSPLLGFDVWEHAYYLQYRNVRADYVAKLWACVNWDDVADRLSKA